MHQCSHVVPQAITIAVKVLRMLHYSLIPSQCIQVDIERLLLSLAIKLHNFWGPKINVKGDQFFYQMPDFCENCHPHSFIPLLLVNVWLITNLQKHGNWLCSHQALKMFYQFEKWEFNAGFFFILRETAGPPIWQKFCQSPPSDTCPHFWTKACPPPSRGSSPQKLKIFNTFLCQIWLLSSPKVPLKAVFHA